jgi:hypothetical protein
MANVKSVRIGRPRKYIDVEEGLVVRRLGNAAEILDAKQISRLLEEHASVGEVAKAVAIQPRVLEATVRRLGIGSPPKKVKSSRREHGAPRPRSLRPSTSGTRTGRYSDAEVLECMRKAQRSLRGQLSAQRYEAFRISRKFRDGRPWPSSQQGPLRFGSWINACAAAGIPSGTPIRRSYTRLWDQAAFEGAVTQYAQVALSQGKNPTVWGYSAWQKGIKDVLPSLSTLRSNRVDMVSIFNKVKGYA